MNYSQLEHMATIMDECRERIDPLGFGPIVGSLLGMRVNVTPDRPRYTLPAEVIPGVPWPDGFREEINRWSVSFLGTVNVIPRGTVYVMGNHLVMRPDDVVKITTVA